MYLRPSISLSRELALTPGNFCLAKHLVNLMHIFGPWMTYEDIALFASLNTEHCQDLTLTLVRYSCFLVT